MPGHEGKTLGYDAATARPFSTEPTDPTGHTPEHAAQAGLTKREMFAMAALQGLLSHPNRPLPITCAEKAVQVADALIAALNARPVVGDMTQITGDYDDPRR